MMQRHVTVARLSETRSALRSPAETRTRSPSSPPIVAGEAALPGGSQAQPPSR